MRIVALAFVALLAGCTTVSEVSPARNGNFTVGTRHMGGVDSWQEI